ncbi:MAG: hypothetical protein O2910_07090 [Proteobacteria bacterium]|nr:hypothetical protein [Pseudomonadota bacterium]
MKTLIVFFYLMNGETVSYTVSDYAAFKMAEGLPAALTCEAMIGNERFAEDVQKGLKSGESMRAQCHRSDSVGALNEPYRTVTSDAP